MSFLANLSKLKSLFPVFVVGASVAITIKLLTEGAPTVTELITVAAKEDILETNYQDELQILEPEVEPQPEEVPPPPVQADEESKPDAPQEEDAEKQGQEDSGGDVSKEEEKDTKKPEDNQEQKKPENKPMKFKENDLGKMLSAIFGKGKKQ